jgi:excisionase family DNA binding protein
MNEVYITVNEAADILKLSPRTVTKYLNTGQLRGAKLGRIWRLEERDVRSFFDSMKDLTAEVIGKGAADAER